MRYVLTFLLLITLLISFSCRKDFTAVLSDGNLIFSKDTVYLDTVFSNIGSSTYNLKVYNKSAKAISIPSIKLKREQSSFYRLNIDGTPGKVFEDVEILAKDSIYIFIETTIDFNQVINPIYTDAIAFDSGENLQEVSLITLVKDAQFLYPSKNTNGLIESITLGVDTEGDEIKVNGFYLNTTTFTNEKPYVIYGYGAVPEGGTLTVEAGATIHFHANSGLIVSKNATLSINGELNNQILIEGDRLEPHFNNLPGQWGAIWLRAGSTNNTISNTIIKNATAGIIIDGVGDNSSPTLTIKNTQIYNSANYGILGRETRIDGENLVINNSGQSSLACTGGGTYNFKHSTFTNFWSNSLRQYPSVYINNYFTTIKNNTPTTETRDLIAANFTNCIIDGNNTVELTIDTLEGSIFNYAFKNNLIKFNDINNIYSDFEVYNFEDTNYYSDNIFNANPDFKNPENNELQIGVNSAGIEKADIPTSLLVPNDILGTLRTLPADIGAYQHTTIED